jgi:hypothetical protein
LTPVQVIRALRTVRYSPVAARIGRRVPGIRTIARYAGLSYRTLYRITLSGQCSLSHAQALTRAFEALAAVTNEQNQIPRSPGSSLRDFLSQYEPRLQPAIRTAGLGQTNNLPAGRTITLKIHWPFDR